MNPVLTLVSVAVWFYAMRLLSKAKLEFWRYMCGVVGSFVLMMFNLKDALTIPLARCVAAIAGIIGNLTNTFVAYLKYGIIYICTNSGSMTLQIDFECSGIIEIMVFIALLAFFKVYTVYERIIVGVLGTACLILCNALRVTLICEIVHFFGTETYFFAHTFIGRIFFYSLTVVLYFYVFTKSHIIRMKVGNFNYGNNKPSA